MYPKPKTLYRHWTAQSRENPALTVAQFASHYGMPEKVMASKLDTARKEIGLKNHISRQAGAITTIDFDVYDGWKKRALFQSDNHHDSMLCDRDLEKRHLDEACESESMIFIFGDFYDAMQGRFDKRKSLDELRPEYRTDRYYDVVVSDGVNFLRPYAQNIELLADGNHEIAVIKYSNTDMLGRTAEALNVQHGGYGGWVVLRFNFLDGRRIAYRIKYFHGSGGEAPVTRGAIQTNRQAVYLPDADMIVNGHSHHNYYIPICRERVNSDGVHSFDIQHHIRIPGYKQSYGNGSAGWDVMRGGVPKPIGAVWVNFEIRGDNLVVSTMPDIHSPHPIEIEPVLYTGRVYAQDAEGE